MIVWHGWGILTVVCGSAGLLFAYMTESAGLAQGYAFGLGLLIAAAINWFLGTHFNNISNGHKLFWIPMQWWSVPAAAFGIVLLALQVTGNYTPSNTPSSGKARVPAATQPAEKKI